MASEPEKDDLAEEETDEAEAEAPAKREEPPPSASAVAKGSSAKAATSSSKASTKSADAKSAPVVAKKKPVVVEEEDEEDDDEDEDDEEEDAPPPPPKKVVVKKKTKKGKAAVVTTKVKPIAKRRKVGPKKPAKAFIPHAIVALAFGYADSRMNAEAVPFHPLAVIGIIILVYAFINIGSANEVGTENALAAHHPTARRAALRTRNARAPRAVRSRPKRDVEPIGAI